MIMGWIPEGKNGLWVWYMDDLVLKQAATRGMDYIMVKAGDATRQWPQFNQALVQECHEHGIACVAWTYAYLDDPAGEAEVAIEAFRRGCDALVLDVEYECINKQNEAAQMVNLIRAETSCWVGYAPDFRIAFGNRWPRGGFSPNLEPWPWKQFNQLDGVMPQLYWPDFAQTPIDTMNLARLWKNGCEGMGWPVPDMYSVLPSTGHPNDIIKAAEYSKTLGFKGATTWRWGSGTTASQFAITEVEWPPVQKDEDEMLRPYLGEMGSPDGGVIRALDAELAKEQPDRQEIENIRNRLVELYNQALGG